MVAPLPLDQSQIARAAEEMIAEYGSEALTKADERAIKDLQESDDPMGGYKNALNKGVFLSE